MPETPAKGEPQKRVKRPGATDIAASLEEEDQWLRKHRGELVDGRYNAVVPPDSASWLHRTVSPPLSGKTLVCYSSVYRQFLGRWKED